jgi:hypothetical protein
MVARMRFRRRSLHTLVWVVGALGIVAWTATPAQAQKPMTCMPKPSACGFPDPTNTGVVPGTPLSPVNGSVTLSTPGQVFENAVVRGEIIVTAPNVTIRNVKLVNENPYYAISVKNNDSWENSQANLTLDHVDIDLGGGYEVKGIAFNGYTARNVLFHNGADCAHFGVNVVIENSLCVVGPDANGDGQPDGDGFCDGPDHFDGFQSDGGSNITLRHNTIRNPCAQTSAIILGTNTSPIDRVVIDHNLMSGGGYTVYCGTSSGVATHTSYTNNVISREFYPNGGYWGPTTECEKVDVAHGNIWDGQYIPPSAGGGPGGGSGSPTGGGSGSPTGSGALGAYFLSKKQARRLLRVALKRRFKSRFTNRAGKLRTSCKRRSRASFACAVRWTSRGGRRYRGKVTVTRVGPKRWRYSMRVRHGRALTKRTGSGRL